MEGVRFSREQCVEMTFIYGSVGRNAVAAAEEFHHRFPDVPKPTSRTINRIMRKFRETGSVGRRKYRQRERPVTGQEATIDVLANVRIQPRLSIRKRAQEAGMSITSMQRILRRNKMFPYKFRRVQELHGDDFQRRMEFCNWFIEQEELNPAFATTILTSDEASFYLAGTVSTQNTRYWSDANPHVIRQDHRQVNPRVNVWCGIYKDRLIGPIFIPLKLTGVDYLQLLDNILPDFLDNLPLAELQRFRFQQDGAPPHYAGVVREWLNVVLPHQWIGRGGPVPWPPRSPDLSPEDFFLWGYLKQRVYVEPPQTVEELKAKILAACALITPDMIRAVLDEWSSRVAHCLVCQGANFEHL